MRYFHFPNPHLNVFFFFFNFFFFFLPTSFELNYINPHTKENRHRHTVHLFYRHNLLNLISYLLPLAVCALGLRLESAGKHLFISLHSSKKTKEKENVICIPMAERLCSVWFYDIIGSFIVPDTATATMGCACDHATTSPSSSSSSNSAPAASGCGASATTGNAVITGRKRRVVGTE